MRVTGETENGIKPAAVTSYASSDRAKAINLIAAIDLVKQLEAEGRVASSLERHILSEFPGFGCVALSVFPNPVTGEYRDGWKDIGEELRFLLTPEEYASAKKSVFNAFYTSPVVMKAMYAAVKRLGVSDHAHALEPGCGIGRFISEAPEGMRFIGVELDSISGRIAKARHPEHDIRIESFADTKLPPLDLVIGNPPFANVTLSLDGKKKLALHDFFIAKSLSALKPGGVLAVVSTHYSLDRKDASSRELMAEQADFVGAIRLPSDAFKREGTAVVTDIILLRKRGPGQEPNHADPDWLETSPHDIEGRSVPINRYFLYHPEQVLGTWSIKDTLYGEVGYSLKSNGDLAEQLRACVARLPQFSSPEIPDSSPAPFVPPPLERHISEGSFFIEGNGIYQVENGQSVPVVYGGVELKANGTMVGKRLAHLIRLRDAARKVLQSQNDGWPQENRVSARWELNRLYDSFVAAYGPVNKTTFSETKDGTTIRRMPNVVKWREDPDAMLVLALEEYDDATGVATRAPILQRDVVGKSQPVTTASSAEDGLLISLDQLGRVDIAFIASLYGKPEEKVIEELGDLIYLNPETKAWETADEYLSGNVRAKLKAAEGIERNCEALKAVQPDDVLPGEIDAALGSPWIPASDIQEFAAELFRVPASAVQIQHLQKDALWSVEGNWEAERSVANTTDYGTPRISGLSLFEQALNLKSPIIYDIVRDGDSETRVLNPDATLAAKEKQRAIKEKFKEWVFSDPDRTERLVRVYNDTYNCLRPRLFDGSHLHFPGMSQSFTPHQHQRDAVWRIISGGNTLLAHVVGAGKTATMISAAMKMRQAGICKKPLFAVPNHMLEQFGREFLHLYPNAKVLIAGKDDFTKDRRKLLTAKIASGDWDGIIVTHSSFERMGLSPEIQSRFLEQQIAEYEELLIDRAEKNPSKAKRNIIKQLEKQKASLEERLKDLMAEDKKDDGLHFDELGIDHVFNDEAHLFKNLTLLTKMERVAGIQTTGSERAFDLYQKCRYLDEKKPGHGITFATGTPVSNSMVEMYTMQKYLDQKGLQDRGIDHFDAWAATFGEVVENMEIAPDGKSLRPRSRFAKFVNLPELQQMFRAFSDVQTADMLDLPRPKLKGGKAQTIACPMSDEQKEIQDSLVTRYEDIRAGRVKDPRIDNALKVTTDGRKLALDARLVAPGRDFPASKINALADNVARIWRESTPVRGTQLVFSDMGVNPTEWGYSVYEDIKSKLIERGIPREQIAEVGDADSDAKKQSLFERVRNGSVRVLLGSTAKMGAGTNVQKRLIGLHHLDAPWKPAEIEQREGRILRQGNTNPEVKIFRYVTSGSFDAYMWQTLETKAKFISQVMTSDTGLRRAEDISKDELSYAEVKAIASGNPAVLTLAETDAELQRLAILRKNHNDEQFLARRNLKELPKKIQMHEEWLANLSADAATVKATAGIVIGQTRCNHELAMAMLTEALNRIPEFPQQTRRYPLGTYRGLSFGLERQPTGHGLVYLEGKAYRVDQLSKDSQGPRAVLNALGRMEESFPKAIEYHTNEKSLSETQLADFSSRLGKVFAHGEYADKLTELRDGLRAALSDTTEGAGERAAELAQKAKDAMASTKVEAVAAKATRRAETPVTARLRKPVVVNHEPVEPVEEPPHEEPKFAAKVTYGRPRPMPASRRPTQLKLF